jgi:hypothetical protein
MVLQKSPFLKDILCVSGYMRDFYIQCNTTMYFNSHSPLDAQKVAHVIVYIIQAILFLQGIKVIVFLRYNNKKINRYPVCSVCSCLSSSQLILITGIVFFVMTRPRKSRAVFHVTSCAHCTSHYFCML